MAEIRINATGGLKLYDADDSHYAQIIAGTITSNVDAITLGHDTVTIADNLSLGSDSAVLKFGADGDTTLTHTDGTGLTLNSTNKICFNDASQFIQGSSGTVLSIGATDEIDLTATAVDLNGTLNVSGVATFQSTPVFPDGSLALADLDIDGGTDIGAAVVDADLFIVDDGAGGTNRKVTASRIKTYAGFGVGDITGATALATIPASTDEFILSDAGTLKRIDYAHLNNTPAFLVRLNGDQEIANNTATKITFDVEEYDTDTAFDPSTNNRFTVPTGKAGMYQFTMGSRMPYLDYREFFKMFFKINGSQALRGEHFQYYAGADNTDNLRFTTSATFTLAADDYVEGWCHHNEGAARDIDGGDSQLTGYTFMSGFRIAGVI